MTDEQPKTKLAKDLQVGDGVLAVRVIVSVTHDAQGIAVFFEDGTSARYEPEDGVPLTWVY